MTAVRPSIGMLKKRRDAKMRKLASIGAVVQGSLVSVKHKACKHTAHMLTFPVKGKTHTVYVPLGMVEEVREWTENYKALKESVRDISKLNLAIIHNYVPTKRAAARSRVKSRQKL
jgi:hypothetical protein